MPLLCASPDSLLSWPALYSQGSRNEMMSHHRPASRVCAALWGQALPLPQNRKGKRGTRCEFPHFQCSSITTSRGQHGEREAAPLSSLGKTVMPSFSSTQWQMLGPLFASSLKQHWKGERERGTLLKAPKIELWIQWPILLQPKFLEYSGSLKTLIMLL